ncbi:hypothetical protein B7486_60060, partial [cyanobacterium TDX16]
MFIAEGARESAPEGRTAAAQAARRRPARGAPGTKRVTSTPTKARGASKVPNPSVPRGVAEAVVELLVERVD